MQSNVIQVIYADMKGYTDLSQSKKLAETLPLEIVDWEKTTTYRVSQAIINLEKK